MKKILLLTILLLSNIFCKSQKINACNYNYVSSIIQYNNAEIISYKNKAGKLISDTIYFNKQKCEINIKEAGLIFIKDEKMVKNKSKLKT